MKVRVEMTVKVATIIDEVDEDRSIEEIKEMMIENKAMMEEVITIDLGADEGKIEEIQVEEIGG